MRKGLLLFAAAAFALAAGPAMAQKKVLAIVVKGLDNAFFEAINQGCQKWNGENASSDYECYYTGPPTTSDEAGEAQIVTDLLARNDVAAIAISPSNAPLIANAVKSASPKIPVMTIDADMIKEDAGLRKTYLGTDNYLMGFRMGEYLKQFKPEGGTVCTIQGNPAADNLLQRGQGVRDALTGQKGLAELKGEGGWTEISGCPVFTNDDGAKGVQAMADLLTANPDIDAFIMTGGWPMFMAPQAYRQLTDQYKDRLDSNDLILIAADTIGEQVPLMKEGRAHALVGQRPAEMGYMAPTVMIDLIEGKAVADPVFTGLDECTKETVDTCIMK
jgi:ribose transport system substrate-binding protein